LALPSARTYIDLSLFNGCVKISRVAALEFSPAFQSRGKSEGKSKGVASATLEPISNV
jgi:hypothetical protein